MNGTNSTFRYSWMSLSVKFRLMMMLTRTALLYAMAVINE